MQSLVNNSNRTVPVAPSVHIPPGGSVGLAPDAIWLLERPLVKAYLADKTLSVTGGDVAADGDNPTDEGDIALEPSVDAPELTTQPATNRGRGRRKD